MINSYFPVLQSSDNTALSSSSSKDYTELTDSDKLEFAEDDTEKCVEIEIEEDCIRESTESFIVSFKSLDGTVGGTSQATVNILDDDCKCV